MQKCECACVCGVCSSSCHVNEEVELYGAIRAVSLQAGLAIWTHGEEPSPDIAFSLPLSVARSQPLSAVRQQWYTVF